MLDCREQISFIEEIKTCFELAAEIQNKGIATVFVNYSGHVNILDIAFHFPIWLKGESPDETISFKSKPDSDCDREYWIELKVLPVINRLKEILATADQRRADEEIIEEKKKQQRLETFLKLREEFDYLKAS